MIWSVVGKPSILDIQKRPPPCTLPFRKLALPPLNSSLYNNSRVIAVPTTECVKDLAQLLTRELGVESYGLHNNPRITSRRHDSMSNLRETLRNLIENLSEKNYEETLAQYRFWLDLGIAHGHVVQGQVENDARQLIQPDQMRNDGEFTHPTAHLFFRFVRDMEDRMVSRSASEYHKHQCAKAVADCFEINLELVKNGSGWSGSFLTDINLIAHWANLGFVEESVIRNHILQSLISHPKLHNHQADALVILFRLAGATFETYADPSVLDRCFQLLEGHCSHGSAKLLVKRKVKQVRIPRVVKGGYRAEVTL